MTELYRLTGAGNDFLALVEPSTAPTPEQIRAWCARGVSLGADGVVALRRGATAGVVDLDYWNADGGWAALCVNATRASAQLAFQLGWAKDTLTVNTGAGPFRARRLSGEEVELEMAPPTEEPTEVSFKYELEGWAITVGVPHAVLTTKDDLGAYPVAIVGPGIRRHPFFGDAGANANFVRFTGEHDFDIRTWERGVEGETLACGSGVLATVVVGVATGELELPARARTKGGFVLTVDGATSDDGKRVTRWTMAGDARVLARIETFPAAERALPPPEWE